MMLSFPILVIPATPIAGSKPPMVVGIRATNNATKDAISILYPTKCPKKSNAPITVMNIIDNPANKIVKAISF